MTARLDMADLEKRMLADAMEDGIEESFNKLIDLHTIRAAKEFGVPESEVTPSMREVAKQMYYAENYGQISFGNTRIGKRLKKGQL